MSVEERVLHSIQSVSKAELKSEFQKVVRDILRVQQETDFYIKVLGGCKIGYLVLNFRHRKGVIFIVKESLLNQLKNTPLKALEIHVKMKMSNKVKK